MDNKIKISDGMNETEIDASYIVFLTAAGDKYRIQFTKSGGGIVVNLIRRSGADQIAILSKMSNSIELISSDA